MSFLPRAMNAQLQPEPHRAPHHELDSQGPRQAAQAAIAMYGHEQSGLTAAVKALNGHPDEQGLLLSGLTEMFGSGWVSSLSEMGEMESLRMQMYMDRRSKFISTISNLLKKSSATSQEITQNMK